MSVHVLREGPRDLPLVLLHAFPVDHRMWQSVADQVPGPRAVLAPDLPGSGTTARDLPAASLDVAADEVARALAAVGVQRAVVAGLSMGGYVALALVERHPDLVAALGLVDTKATADTPEAYEARLRTAAAVDDAGLEPVRAMPGTLLGETTRAARPQVADLVTAWIEDQPPAGVSWSLRAMAARPDRSDVLRAYPGPVAVVVGDEDGVTPVAAAEHMVALAPDARLVVVPHAGHLTAVEQPAAVAAALGDLASRV